MAGDMQVVTVTELLLSPLFPTRSIATVPTRFSPPSLSPSIQKRSEFGCSARQSRDGWGHAGGDWPFIVVGPVPACPVPARPGLVLSPLSCPVLSRPGLVLLVSFVGFLFGFLFGFLLGFLFGFLF